MNERPLNILVVLTHMCNMNCEYCFDKVNREQYKDMILSDERIEKLIDLASKYSKEISLVWHGGEPTCVPLEKHREYQDYITSKYKTNFHQVLQTNGSLLNEEWQNFLLENGIYPTISYDGIETLRKGCISSITVAENLRKLKKNNIDFSVICTLNHENYDKQIELYDEIYALGTEGINFLLFFSTTDDKKNELQVFPSEYQKAHLEFLKHSLKNYEYMEKNLSMFVQAVLGISFSSCTHSDCRFKRLAIAPDGTILPCDRIFTKKYHLGKVEEFDSIEDVFSSQRYQMYCDEVDARFNDYCYKCHYFHYCKGGCNADVITKFNSATLIDENVCQNFKNSFNSTYYLLREIDSYNHEYMHPDILYLAISEFKFFPFEIFETIKNILNTEVELIPQEDILTIGDKLIESKEIRLLEFFNYTEGALIPRIPYNINFEEKEKMLIERQEALELFIKNNEDLIFQILQKSKASRI